MKIIEDLHDLLYSLHAKKNATEVAKIFGRERKWVYVKQQTESFVIDYNFIAGLDSIGYEIILRKKEK